MTKQTYRAKPGAQFSPKKAQEYGEELQRIAEKNGGSLKPEVVVEEARDKNSVLHDYFQWDNKKAGERWRIFQARQLINHIEYVIEYEEQEKTVPLFISIVRQDADEKPRREYVSIDVVAKDKDLYELTLQEALKELMAWQMKYQNLKELREIFGAIEKTQKELEFRQKTSQAR